jgi:DNA (cytosine-5)-methyltransferase 1
MLKFNGIDITPYLSTCGRKHPKTSRSGLFSENVETFQGMPFMVSAGGPEGKGRQPKSIHEPLGTVLTENHDALIQPFLVVVNHGEKGQEAVSARCHSLEKPFPTVTTKNGYGLVSAFLTKYYGTSVSAQSLDDPLDAVTTRDRFALIESSILDEKELQLRTSELGPLIPLGDGLFLDIRFRMLQWHELAAAQGFPSGYIFCGNKATKVKQIGNAVPCYSAKALCLERLRGYAPVLPHPSLSLPAQAAC